MVEQFERNTVDFLQGEYASDNRFRQEVGIANVDNDDTLVSTAIEFQAMIKNLERLNALVGQLFNERMDAQVEDESKQLKVLVEKTKAMS